MRITAIIEDGDGFGDVLELAGIFGWEDNFPDAESDGDGYTPDVADHIEQSAIEYLAAKGVTVVYEEDLEDEA